VDKCLYIQLMLCKMGSINKGTDVKARYVNSPSHRKAERDLFVKVVWTIFGMLVVFALMWLGFFELEGGLPLQDS
jgi:hypothetical protein